MAAVVFRASESRESVHFAPKAQVFVEFLINVLSVLAQKIDYAFIKWRWVRDANHCLSRRTFQSRGLGCMFQGDCKMK